MAALSNGAAFLHNAVLIKNPYFYVMLTNLNVRAYISTILYKKKKKQRRRY